MKGWYDWIRNIACYLVLISVVSNILPGKKYEKYIRLFTGLMFILIVFQPLTGTLNLEDKLLYYFETFTFREETGDLTKEILGIEEQRKQQMLHQYEKAVAMDICNMAKEEGWEEAAAEVEIEADEQEESYGMVKHVTLVLSDKIAGDSENTRQYGIEPVEPIKVEMTDSAPLAQEAEMQDERTASLRRRLMSYYDLEESYVEIQIQNSER